MEGLEMGVEEYLKSRIRRISLAFIGVLGAALLALVPVFFFLVHNRFAGIGASAALIACLGSLILVRGGMERTGNAVFFSACLIIIDVVAWASHSSGGTLSTVLISVVGLTIIVLMPTGILITPRFAVIVTVAAFVFLLPTIVLSKNPDLIHRIPLFAVVYLFSGAIIYVLSTVQDSLLRKAISEGRRSESALASARDTLHRVDETRVQVDRAQQVVGEHLDRISEIVESYTARVSSVSGGYHALADAVTGSREELGNLDESVQLIAGHMKTQSDLVGKSSDAEERIASDLRSMSERLKSASETNMVLAESAEKGRENVAALVGIIDELKDYQRRLSSVNQTIQRIGAQTNILAMNASIEAAHAGAAGRGFSVVADEVRALSDESSSRTKEIATLIRGMNSAISRGVETIGLAGDSLLEVNHHAELSRPVIQDLSSGMQQNLEVLTAMTDNSRQLVGITRDIEHSAGQQQGVFGKYRETFGLLSERLVSTVRQLQELQQHTDTARDILAGLASVRAENERLGRRIADLLGSQDNDVHEKVID